MCVSLIVINICNSISFISNHLNDLFFERSNFKFLHHDNLIWFLKLLSNVIKLLAFIFVVLSSVKRCTFDNFSFWNESSLFASLETALRSSLSKQIWDVLFRISHWSHRFWSFLLDVHLHHSVLFVHLKFHFNYLLLKWNDSLVKQFLSISKIIQVSNELLILFGSLLDVILCSSFILNCINLYRCNRSLHVSKLSIKFFNRFRIFLLLLDNLISSWHDIVLVKLH